MWRDGTSANENQCSVNMDSGDRGKFSPKAWEVSTLKSIVDKWETFMIQNDGWNALCKPILSLLPFSPRLPHFSDISQSILHLLSSCLSKPPSSYSYRPRKPRPISLRISMGLRCPRTPHSRCKDVRHLPRSPIWNCLHLSRPGAGDDKYGERAGYYRIQRPGDAKLLA